MSNNNDNVTVTREPITEDFLKEQERIKQLAEDALKAHYANMGIEPLEVLQTLLSRDQYYGFLIGNIIKYAMRQGHKFGEPATKDATKCRSYLKLLREFEEN